MINISGNKQIDMKVVNDILADFIEVFKVNKMCHGEVASIIGMLQCWLTACVVDDYRYNKNV